MPIADLASLTLAALNNLALVEGFDFLDATSGSVTGNFSDRRWVHVSGGAVAASFIPPLPVEGEQYSRLIFNARAAVLNLRNSANTVTLEVLAAWQIGVCAYTPDATGISGLRRVPMWEAL